MELQGRIKESKGVPTLCFVGKEFIDLGGGSVVSSNNEAMVVHVQDQILSLMEFVGKVMQDPLLDRRKGEKGEKGLEILFYHDSQANHGNVDITT